MKRIYHLLAIIISFQSVAHAQNEQNIWAFGTGTGLNFNSGAPVSYSTNMFPWYEGSSSVCDENGRMLFYSSGLWVWNRNNEIMPEMTNGIPGFTQPLSTTIAYPPLLADPSTTATQGTAICRMPAHPEKYYLFCLNTNGQLYYSVIDTNLNGGLGGIVTGKKSVFLTAGLAEKLTVVKGCNNVWLMARSRNNNQYLAYEINDTGIVTNPVVSNIGLMPATWYRQGVLKFSHDGSRMVAACHDPSGNKGGLELYDFDAKSGMVINPVLLDSSSTLGNYYGACFSGDNLKLYASTSSSVQANSFVFGKVRQFDLGMSTTAAIISSNTIVFTDNISQLNNIGDLKLGPNGKMYFGNGKAASGFPTVHCISSPNVAGVGCNVVPNALALPNGRWSYRGLPNDVAILQNPDTVYIRKDISVCFKHETVITADSGKRYSWRSGSTSRSIVVTTDGVYTVGYINSNCKYEIDSFNVIFIDLPKLQTNGFTCQNTLKGSAKTIPSNSNTTSFNYEWRDAAGNILKSRTTSSADSLIDIASGYYHLRITTPGGCDTTITFEIKSLPLPSSNFQSDSLVCKEEILKLTYTGDGISWRWHLDLNQTSTDRVVQWKYYAAGVYKISLVAKNIEGCYDTSVRSIVVKDLNLKLTSNKSVVSIGEEIQLYSTGSENYDILSWKPVQYFQSLVSHSPTVKLDSTITFTVIGQSLFGCIDSASLRILVNPKVFMPSAFTPNNDGRNDRFRPRSVGDKIFVRHFEIYNRWGQLIWSAYGPVALDGWDGIYNGRPAESGTYFYVIDIELNGTSSLPLKGDFTLLR